MRVALLLIVVVFGFAGHLISGTQPTATGQQGLTARATVTTAATTTLLTTSNLSANTYAAHSQRVCAVVGCTLSKWLPEHISHSYAAPTPSNPVFLAMIY